MSQIDWFASLGSLIGAVLPRNAAPDSYDRLGNLLGEDDTDRPWVLEQALNHALSLRTNEWKYIEPSKGVAKMATTKIETGYLNAPQLYSTASPYESENLAETHPQQVVDFELLLQRIREKNYADTLE